MKQLGIIPSLEEKLATLQIFYESYKGRYGMESGAPDWGWLIGNIAHDVRTAESVKEFEFMEFEPGGLIGWNYLESLPINSRFSYENLFGYKINPVQFGFDPTKVMMFTTVAKEEITLETHMHDIDEKVYIHAGKMKNTLTGEIWTAGDFLVMPAYTVHRIFLEAGTSYMVQFEKAA